MKELIKGIKDRFAANSTLATAFGVLYYDELPENTEKPYAMFSIITSVPEPTFGSRYTENSRVQIDLFGTDFNAMMGYHDTLNSHFDRCTLSPASGSAIECVRAMNLPPRLDGTNKANDKVYHVGSDFRCRIDR